jgi:hypothetical protein
VIPTEMVMDELCGFQQEGCLFCNNAGRRQRSGDEGQPREALRRLRDGVQPLVKQTPVRAFSTTRCGERQSAASTQEQPGYEISLP